MVTLTYPYTSPSITLVLPNPILGNADQIEEPFTLDWSASGRVYTYLKSTGDRKLLLTFKDLTFTERANLKLFLYDAINNTSGYLDNLNVQWQGIFINDPFEQSNTHRSYGDITLEFKGRKV
jgi:hypothetical protein